MKYKTARNSKFLFKHFLLYVFVSSFSIANAQDVEDVEKKALAKLSFMMGNWKGTSTVYSKDTTKTVVVSEKIHYLLDGNLLALEVKSPLVHIHTIIRYSVEDNSYYYHPFTKTSGGRGYKGKIEDQKFIVQIDDKNRLIFKKTDDGRFHEYGESFIKGKWEKYFEDLLYPISE